MEFKPSNKKFNTHFMIKNNKYFYLKCGYLTVSSYHKCTASVESNLFNRYLHCLIWSLYSKVSLPIERDLSPKIWLKLLHTSFTFALLDGIVRIISKISFIVLKWAKCSVRSLLYKFFIHISGLKFSDNVCLNSF